MTVTSGRRQVLTDGSGKWFNIDKAEKFDEEAGIGIRGSIISETLYRTAGGKWILHRYLPASIDSWTTVSSKEAAAWILLNDCPIHPDLDDDINELEIP